MTDTEAIPPAFPGSVRPRGSSGRSFGRRRPAFDRRGAPTSGRRRKRDAGGSSLPLHRVVQRLRFRGERRRRLAGIGVASGRRRTRGVSEGQSQYQIPLVVAGEEQGEAVERDARVGM